MSSPGNHGVAHILHDMMAVGSPGIYFVIQVMGTDWNTLVEDPNVSELVKLDLADLLEN